MQELIVYELETRKVLVSMQVEESKIDCDIIVANHVGVIFTSESNCIVEENGTLCIAKSVIDEMELLNAENHVYLH